MGISKLPSKLPKPDATKIQTEVNEAMVRLASLLVNVQDPAFAPHATREERTAARYLYEQIINYRGMLIKRKLINSIEFICAHREDIKGFDGPGWYFHREKSHWQGPYPSHYQALIARDEGKPKSIAELAIHNVLALD